MAPINEWLAAKKVLRSERVKGMPQKQPYLNAGFWSLALGVQVVLLIVGALFDIVMLARVLKNMGMGRQVYEAFGYYFSPEIWSFVLALILLVILISTMLMAGQGRFDTNKMPVPALILWVLGLAAISFTRLFMLGAETATVENEADLFGRIFTTDNSGAVAELLMMDVFSVLTGALAYKLGGPLLSKHMAAYRRMSQELYNLQDEINEDVKSLEKLAAKPRKIIDNYNYHWRETKAEGYANCRNTYLKMLDEFVFMAELDGETLAQIRQAEEEVPEEAPESNEGKSTTEVVDDALISNLHIPNANISGRDLPPILPPKTDYQPTLPVLPEGYVLMRDSEGKPIEAILREIAEIASSKKSPQPSVESPKATDGEQEL